MYQERNVNNIFMFLSIFYKIYERKIFMNVYLVSGCKTYRDETCDEEFETSFVITVATNLKSAIDIANDFIVSDADDVNAIDNQEYFDESNWKGPIWVHSSDYYNYFMRISEMETDIGALTTIY